MTEAGVWCRICLSPEQLEKHQLVFTNSSKIALKIFLISGVQLVESEDHPEVICKQCLQDLYKADTLRRKCLEADEHFRSIKSLNFSGLDEVISVNSIRCKVNFENEVKPEPFELEDGNTISGDSINAKSSKRKTRCKNLQVTSSEASSPKKRETAKFFCSKCFKCFSDEGYLKKHEYFGHAEIPIEDLFKCDFCGHRTKTKQLIRNHINAVHSTRPKEKFICRICGKMLSTKGNLDGHEKTHIEIDPSDYVSCPICQKAFKEKRFMIEHRKLVHDKSKAFQCPHCLHVSTCKGAYNKHFKSVHLKLRDFICTDCGLGFSTNSQLTRHFRIHTGERPYECTNCSKPFRLSSHRKRHEEICPKRLNQ